MTTGEGSECSSSCQSRASSGQQQQHAPPTNTPAGAGKKKSATLDRPPQVSEAGGRSSNSLPGAGRGSGTLAQVHVAGRTANRSGQSSKAAPVKPPTKTSQAAMSSHQNVAVGNRTVQSSQPANGRGQSSQPANGRGQSSQPANRTGQSSIPANVSVQSSQPSNRTGQSSQAQNRAVQSSQPANKSNQSSQHVNRSGQSSQPANNNRINPNSQPIRINQNAQQSNRTGQSSQAVTNTGQGTQPVARTGESSQPVSRSVMSSSVQTSNRRPVEGLRAGTGATLKVSKMGNPAVVKKTPVSGSRTLPAVAITTASSSSSHSSSSSGRTPMSQGQQSRSQPNVNVVNNSRSVVIANRGASSTPSRSPGAVGSSGAGLSPNVRTQQRAASHSPQRQTHRTEQSRNTSTQPRSSNITQSRPANNARTQPVISNNRTNSPSDPSRSNNRSVDTHEIQLDVLQNTNNRESAQQPSSVLHRFENNEALPDILNSHLLPPYTAPRQNQHRSPPANQGRGRGGNRNQGNSRSRSHQRTRTESGMTTLGGEDKPCCNKECCLSCVTIMTTFRWMLVTLAMIGVICVITGIILGALHMTVGEKFLTLSLMFIGLGVLLVVVVGVGWRCTPTGHEPCHVLFNLGEYRTAPARSTRGVTRQQRGNLWHGGLIYSDFRHRRPPPSYTASMQEYQQQQIRAISPAPGTIDNLSLPSSPPPTYRSRASTVRPGIHITFPPVSGEYPTSRPPTYRSHAGDERPALSSISGLPTPNTNDDITQNNNTTIVTVTNSSLSTTNSPVNSSENSSREITPQRSLLPANDVSTLHREQEVVRYLEGMLDDQIRDLGENGGVDNLAFSGMEGNGSEVENNRVVVNIEGDDTRIITTDVEINMTAELSNGNNSNSRVEDSDVNVVNTLSNHLVVSENTRSVGTNQNTDIIVGAENCKTVANNQNDTAAENQSENTANQKSSPENNIVPSSSTTRSDTSAESSAGCHGVRNHVTVEDKNVQSSVTVKSAETQTVSPPSGRNEEAEVSDTQL